MPSPNSSFDVIYSENIAGVINDTIIINGYLRKVRAGSGYYITMKILPEDGASMILNNENPKNIEISGSSSNGKKIKLSYVRPLFSEMPKFQVIGHRGGGRNSDRYGYSENSIEMMHYSQILGATAVEIDIKPTRDKKLIVFHDDTFSPRTVRGAYLLGNVENFDLNQIKALGRLINGESIPTLDEALLSIIENTTLSLVWIDVKDPSTVDEVIRSISRADSLAYYKGKNVEILMGIPNNDILNAYRNSKLQKNISILVELDVDIAKSFDNCVAWAPRWTNKISNSEINSFKSARPDRMVFVWTVDIKEYINKYLNQSGIDGILSNYPSLVSAMHLSRE